MDIAEVRRERLRRLLARPEFAGHGAQVRFGAAIGKAPAQVSQWLNGTRSINEASARHIEEKLRLEPLWMDGGQPSNWPFREISPAAWAELSDAVQSRAEAAVRLIIEASLPPNAPSGGYSRSQGAVVSLLHEPTSRRYLPKDR